MLRRLAAIAACVIFLAAVPTGSLYVTTLPTGADVWIDGTYYIEGGEELEKYRRESEVAFGPVDTVKYAGAFGATGLMIRTTR